MANGRTLCNTIGRTLTLALLSLGLSNPAAAEPAPGPACTAMLLGRTAPVAADGSFLFPGVARLPGGQRVRLVCAEGGALRYGRSDVFRLAGDGAAVDVPEVVFGEVDPLPVALEVTAPRLTLTEAGERVQLGVFGLLPDGGIVDLTADPATFYSTPSPNVFTVSNGDPGEDAPRGTVTARGSGRQVVLVRHEGVVGAIVLAVQLVDDRDRDGLPDAYELANGLDPDDSTDAAADRDGDGLSNRDEQALGTSPSAADSDGDRLADGEEVARGTRPADRDSDDDRLTDGDEIRLGTNALVADSDGDRLPDGLEIELGADPLAPNATTTLVGTVTIPGHLAGDGAAVVAFGQLAGVSAASGRFVVPNVPADLGPIELAARWFGELDGGSGRRAREARGRTVVPVPGGTTTASLALEDAANLLFGQVRAPGGAAVPFARVTVANALERRATNADAAGRYGFENLASGPYELRALDPRTGHEAWFFGEVGERVEPVDLDLSAFGSFVGTIFGRDTVTPVAAGVAVEARGGGVFSTLTRAGGRYRLVNLPLGGYALDAAGPDGERGATRATLGYSSQVAEVDFGFLGRGRVSGRVLDRDGAPVAGASVEVESQSVLGGRIESVSSSADGSFVLPGVFVGSFAATARRAGAFGTGGGEIRFDGDEATLELRLDATTATLDGTVSTADGGSRRAEVAVYDAASGRVAALGLSTSSNAAGDFTLEDVPADRALILRAEDDGGVCGWSDPVTAPAGARRTVPITLAGGRLEVTARYADGSPVARAAVRLEPLSGSRSCDATGGTTGAFGTVQLGPTQGTFQMRTSDPVCGRTIESSVQVAPAGVTPAHVTFEPFGTVFGRVIDPTGAPVGGIEVRARGRSDVTDPAGRYEIGCVDGGTGLAEVLDRSGARLAEAGFDLDRHGERAEVDLAVVGRGRVSGRVTREDGLPAAGLGVTVRSRGVERSGRTGSDGRYAVEGVPVGEVEARAIDFASGFEGRATGTIAAEGATATIDLTLRGSLVVRRFDANNYVYPVRFPNGSLAEGTAGAFGGDGGERRDALVLSLGEAGELRPFTADTWTPGTRLDGADASGLLVSRRIDVDPRGGYFARYLDRFTNPTGREITVDVVYDTFLRHLELVRNNLRVPQRPAVLASGDGDRTIDAARDSWSVVAVEVGVETGFIRLSDLYPTTAHVTDGGAGVALRPAAVTVEADDAAGATRWRTTFARVSVPPGESVALLHFLSQETGTAAAVAAAERLMAVPPEALAELSAEERAAVANFHLPADGVSTLPTLPPLDGTVAGTVFAADGVTPVPSSLVQFRSRVPQFQRRIERRTGLDGRFEIAAVTGAPGLAIAVPRGGFELQALHPGTLVYSPVTAGDFAAGEPRADQDVVFTGTGGVRGRVRRPGGEVISTGTVEIAGRSQLVNLRTAVGIDGSFAFSGLPPGLYGLSASQPHPQGSPLGAAVSVTVTAETPLVEADVTLPATGVLAGRVRTGSGHPVVGRPVRLESADRTFYREAATDTTGAYRLDDVPLGGYLLSARDAETPLTVTVPVTVAAGTTTRDVQFAGVGTVVVEASFPDGTPAAGAPVSLRRDPYDPTGFYGAGTTDATGRLTIPEVPAGSFAVRVAHPRNGQLLVQAAGALPAAGATVEIAVTVPADLPPSVAVTAPAPGTAVLEGASLAVQVAAADDHGLVRVELLVDGVVAGAASAPPFVFTVPALAADGGSSLTLVAAALDGAGQRTTSAPVTVTLSDDTRPPVVNFTQPGAGAALVEGTTLAVTAPALDDAAIDRVELQFEGTSFATLRSAPYTAVFTLPADFAAAGARSGTFTAVAWDRAGNRGTTSRTVSVLPDAPPVVTIVSGPAPGSTVRELSSVTFVADARDDVGLQVELLVDGEPRGMRSSPPYQFEVPVPGLLTSGGSFAVVLRARDTINQTSVTPPVVLQVIPDAPPTVTLTAPAEGTEVFGGAPLVVTATAGDDTGIDRVEFFVDGRSIGIDRTAPYQATGVVPAGEAGGSITVRATAADLAGRSASDLRTLVRGSDGGAPVVTLTAPAPGTTARLGPVDLVVVLDDSSFAGRLLDVDLDGNDLLDDPVAAAYPRLLETTLELLTPGLHHVGVVEATQGLPNRLSSLTADFAVLAELAGRLPDPRAADLDLGRALEEARSVLAGTLAERRTARPVILVLGAGPSTIPAATFDLLRGSGIAVHTVAIGAEADLPTYRDLASATGGAFLELPDPAAFAGRFPVTFAAGLDALALAADAEDDGAVTGVDFQLEPEDVTVTDEAEPWAALWSVAEPAPGTLTVRATARDAAGNETRSAPVAVEVTAPDHRPAITRIFPAAGRPGDRVFLGGRFFPPGGGATVRVAGQPVAVLSSNKFFLELVMPAFTGDVAVIVEAEGETSKPVTFQFDTDGDGLGDTDEIERGIDPAVTDTDGDGLADGDEVFVWSTDPTIADSDGDGLGDGFEADAGFDPRTPGEAGLDPDGDGLTNLEEQTAGSYPYTAHSDGDGLPDGDEVRRHGTDPRRDDTDGGGEDDGTEVARGTDPLDPADDRPLVPLPVTLEDGDGLSWSVEASGFVVNPPAPVDPGLVELGNRLTVEGTGFFAEPFATAFTEAGGRELVFEGPERDGLRLSRKLYLRADGAGFLRTIETVENRGSSPVTVTVAVSSRLRAGLATSVVATASGDLGVGPGDDFVVLDDTADGTGFRATAFAFAGPNAPVRPSALRLESDVLTVEYRLTVPAGARRSLLHLAAGRTARADAVAAAVDLRALRGAALDDLTPAERAEIANFFAYPDADLDGLADADETEAGTDPDDPDTDDDGLSDGFEAHFGLDPRSAADGDGDPDGDGLDNRAEQLAGTDPHDPDTDDDELMDGAEVTLHGTDPRAADTDGGGLTDGAEIAAGGDPLDPADDAPSLPRTLVDGGGFPWDVRPGGAIGEYDPAAPYDAGFQLFVAGLSFPADAAANVPVNVEDGGRELVLGPVPLAGLDVTRKVFVPAGDAFVRYLEILDNPGPAPVTTGIEIATDLGTEGYFTQVVLTSSGDLDLDAADRYLITDDDGVDGTGFAVTTELFAGDGARTAPDAASLFGDFMRVSYPVTVPARGRAIVMHYGLQRTARSAALAAVERLTRFEGEARAGMTGDELAAVVNFAAVDDADGDGLADGDEIVHGTDPDDPDSDDDRLVDGFEVVHGFDPLDPADAALDADDDGLSNRDEATRGSDPRDPDSDDDGLRDGDEVGLGTDPANADSDGGGVLDGAEIDAGRNPLDPADDGVTLPVDLVDGAGRAWTIDEFGSVGTADGPYASLLRLDGVEDPVFDGLALDDPGSAGRELELGPGLVGDVAVTKKIFVPGDDSFVRFLEIFDNRGSVPLEVEAAFRDQIGFSTVVATSSGDAVVDPGDLWAVSDDEDPVGGLPAAVHVFAGAGAAVPPEAFAAPEARVEATYRLTLPPGGRAILMHLTAVAGDRAAAMARAAELASLAGAAREGLDDTESAAIVNFALVGGDP